MIFYHCLIVLIFTIYHSDYVTAGKKYRTITLHNGVRLKGIKEKIRISHRSRNILKFLGVPYAQPPVGALRFAPPQPLTYSTNKIDATKYQNQCWGLKQTIFEQVNKPMYKDDSAMSEDCLYLNIWRRASKKHKNLPVMVWLHGEAFAAGSANAPLFDGSVLAVKQKVIVVTMQYRLGPFGFLYLPSEQGTADDGLAPGNMGILDQQFGLKWVHENIASFGGDPKKVTLFGQSAGAASVSLHIISSISRKFFKRAIIQSGSLFSRWALDTPQSAIQKTLAFSEACGCGIGEGERSKMIACLQAVEPSYFISKLSIVHKLNDMQRCNILERCDPTFSKEESANDCHLYLDAIFQPVADDIVITKDVLGMKNPEIKLDVMIGTVRNEAAYFLLNGAKINNKLLYNASGYVQFPKGVIYDEVSNVGANLYWFVLANILSKKYMHSVIYDLPGKIYLQDTVKNHPAEALFTLDQLAGKIDFVCPTNKFANFIADKTGSNVYLYKFLHETVGMPPSGVNYAVLHGTEIQYVFGVPLNPKWRKAFQKYTRKERRLSKRIMQLWGNFAKNGRSTSRKWNEYTTDRYKYLVMGNNLFMSYNYDIKFCQFLWNIMDKAPKRCSAQNNY